LRGLRKALYLKGGTNTDNYSNYHGGHAGLVTYDDAKDKPDDAKDKPDADT